MARATPLDSHISAAKSPPPEINISLSVNEAESLIYILNDYRRAHRYAGANTSIKKLVTAYVAHKEKLRNEDPT